MAVARGGELAAAEHGAHKGGGRKLQDVVEQVMTRQDCVKSVRDLNRETARYCALVVSLGAAHDTYRLRAELASCRRRACRLARAAAAALLPHLTASRRGRRPGHHQQAAGVGEDYERLWVAAAAAGDLLHRRLRRTARLVTAFPLHAADGPPPLLIHTGALETLPVTVAAAACRHGNTSNQATIHPMDYHSHDKAAYEWTELTHLHADMCELGRLLQETAQSVDVQPWDIEPMRNAHLQSACTPAGKSVTSVASEVSSDASDVTADHVPPGASHGQQRCVCVVASILLSTVVIAIVIGVCIAFLT